MGERRFYKVNWIDWNGEHGEYRVVSIGDAYDMFVDMTVDEGNYHYVGLVSPDGDILDSYSHPQYMLFDESIKC